MTILILWVYCLYFQIYIWGIIFYIQCMIEIKELKKLKVEYGELSVGMDEYEKGK